MSDSTHNGGPGSFDEAAMERAVDGLFEREGPSAGSPSAGSPSAGSPEAEAAKALISAARSALAPGASEALRAKRVAGRVLAATTRAGDSDSDSGGARHVPSGSLLDFAAERLRRSALVRVAAALLIVQLTLVPLVAWTLLTKPAMDGIRVDFEYVEDLMAHELPAEELGDVVGGTGSRSADEAIDRLRLEDAVAEENDLLGRVMRSMADSGLAPRGSVGALLQGLDGGSRRNDTLGAGENPLGADLGAEGALLALRIEGVLRRPAGSDAWGGLAEDLRRLGLVVNAAGAAGQTQGELELERRAFAHAGLLDVGLPPLTVGAETLVLGPPPVLRGRAWLTLVASRAEALQVALGGQDPYVAAWVQAVREL